MPHQLASYESRLMRGLGVTQRQAAEFLDRLVPTVLLGDVTGFEASDAFFQRPFISMDLAGAVVGEESQTQLFNPLGSGVDIVLELGMVRVPGATDVELRVSSAGLGNLSITKGFRDRRLTGLPAGELRSASDAVGGTGDILGFLALAASPSEMIPLDVFLNPGQGFHFRNKTANASLSVTWYGFEQNRE